MSNSVGTNRKVAFTIDGRKHFGRIVGTNYSDKGEILYNIDCDGYVVLNVSKKGLVTR